MGQQRGSLFFFWSEKGGPNFGRVYQTCLNHQVLFLFEITFSQAYLLNGLMDGWMFGCCVGNNHFPFVTILRFGDDIVKSLHQAQKPISRVQDLPTKTSNLFGSPFLWPC